MTTDDTPTTARSLTDEEWRDGLERIASGYTSIGVELAKALEDKGLVSIAFEGDGRAAVNLTDDGEACLDYARETAKTYVSGRGTLVGWHAELVSKGLVGVDASGEYAITPLGRACLRAGEAS